MIASSEQIVLQTDNIAFAIDKDLSIFFTKIRLATSSDF